MVRNQSQHPCKAAQSLAGDTALWWLYICLASVQAIYQFKPDHNHRSGSGILLISIVACRDCRHLNGLVIALHAETAGVSEKPASNGVVHVQKAQSKTKIARQDKHVGSVRTAKLKKVNLQNQLFMYTVYTACGVQYSCSGMKRLSLSCRVMPAITGRLSLLQPHLQPHMLLMLLVSSPCCGAHVSS